MLKLKKKVLKTAAQDISTVVSKFNHREISLRASRGNSLQFVLTKTA